MRIVPVLDLMAGQVVRGIAGRRETYRPIVSELTSSSDPMDVARAFRDRYGLLEMYLADLDAIAGARPALPIYAKLQALGLHLWVDAGVRVEKSVMPLVEAGIRSIVVGLETLVTRKALAAMTAAIGSSRVVFSLDLRESKPIAGSLIWDERDPWQIACEAIALGVRRILVLDLARVGLNGGTGTEDLCKRLGKAHGSVEVSCGGGVRGIDDLTRLEKCGVRNVLVASALHDGQISPDDIRTLHHSFPAGLHS